MTSAYPRPIEELVPLAKRFARQLGRMPSQNQLKAHLHVRAERAKAVLQVLSETGFDPSAPEPDPQSQPHLHVVPDTLDGQGNEEPGANAGDQSGRVNSGGPEPVPDVQPGTGQTDQPPKPSELTTGAREPATQQRTVAHWPVILLAAPAFVAIWSGWVGVGELAGFGPVRPLPGIADGLVINSAITLPIGMETYAAYALKVWLSEHSPSRARNFAKWSAIAAFVLGGLGQIAYHLMDAANLPAAPWLITAAVSCLPVVVLGFGAALVHLQRDGSGGAR